MSEPKQPDKRDSQSVQRITKSNRKDVIPPTAPLFMPGENEKTEEEINLPPPDLSVLGDDDGNALNMLASLSEDEVRPVRVTPQAERFPPLAPTEAESLQSTATSAQPTQLANKRQANAGFYNFITFLSIIGIIGFIIAFVIIWQEPRSYLNPFPPEVRYQVVTATPQSIIMATPQLNATPALIAQATSPAVDASADNDLSDSPLAIATLVPDFPFVQQGNDIFIANTNGEACNWASIAGIVINQTGSPLNGFRVRITTDAYSETVFTGANQTFGEGGYEFIIAQAPTVDDFTVQLLSPQSVELSPAISITTRNDCDGNVAIINFTQVAPF